MLSAVVVYDVVILVCGGVLLEILCGWNKNTPFGNIFQINWVYGVGELTMRVSWYDLPNADSLTENFQYYLTTKIFTKIELNDFAT